MSIETPVDLVLIEDNPQDLELALLALTEAVPLDRIRVARDGQEALDFLLGGDWESVVSRVGALKVILLDLKLPKIDGLEVLKRLRADERTKLVPIVVLTSSREQRDVVESYRLGVNSYIVKPVNFERFNEAVRNLACYWNLHNQPPQFAD
jgi:two-component system response regulator